MKHLLLSLIYFSLFRIDARAEQISDELQNRIFENFSKHFPTSTCIEFSANSTQEFIDPLVKRNPKIAKVNMAAIDYSGVLFYDKFRITAISTLANGEVSAPFVAAYNGETFSYLNPSGGTSLQNISKSHIPDPDGTMDLGTVILLPYSFLFESSSEKKLPFITLDKANASELWKSTFVDAVQTKSNEDTVEIKFGKQKDGTYFVVEFSKKMDFFPINFRKFSNDGALLIQYQVLKDAVLSLNSTDAFAYPKEATIEFFANNTKFIIIRSKVSQIRSIKQPEDEVFEIDPGSASDIWDIDNKVQILVPK